MSWYKTGTISVTNGSAIVVGTGTAFIANVAPGEGLQAPDGKIYEINTVVSDTQLTLISNYLGVTAGNQVYSIIPSQSFIRDLASQAATLVGTYSTLVNGVGAGKFTDGTVALPGIAFTADTDTGLFRNTTNSLQLVTGGAARLTAANTGVSVVGTLSTSGNATLGDSTSVDSHTINGASTISASSTTHALKVTQAGTGNAFVVEDENSDTSPFVIDSTGRVIIGKTGFATGDPTSLHVYANTAFSPQPGITNDAADNSGSYLRFHKKRGNGSIVQYQDTVSTMYYGGWDGTTILPAAYITAAIDGTPVLGSVPGRLTFSTTPEGGAAPSERLRISSSGAHSITAASTTPALKVTQASTGDAFVVEDVASDTSPFVVQSDGTVLIGHNTKDTTHYASLGKLQLSGANDTTSAITTTCYNTFDSVSPWLLLAKSAASAPGSRGIVANGELLGSIAFEGDDGVNFIRGSQIQGFVAGTPGLNSIPSAIKFSTTANGSTVLTERMRLGANGSLQLGGTNEGTGKLGVIGYVGVAATGYAISIWGAYDTVYTNGVGVSTSISFPANSGVPYTVSSYTHCSLIQSTINADCTLTTQIGFQAGSSLTGAATNYGFMSQLNSATGRWNYYASGSAPNYFAGDLRTGTTILTNTSATNSNITAVATASSLLTGIRTATPAANITLQVPTGTSMDAAFQELQIGQSFEWSYINLAPVTFTCTVITNTAHTLVGSMIVDPNKSGRFLTRKSAANTFVTYRIA